MKEMKWYKRDTVKLSTYVRKFNTSITKLTSAHPELADAGLLPKKLSVKEIKSRELTRKDFNNLIKSIDRWFKPKAREVITRGGINMTRWEYNEVKYSLARINAEKRRRLGVSTRSLRQQSALENKIQSITEKLQQIEKRINRDNAIEENTQEAYQSWESFKQRVFRQGTEKYQEEQSQLYYYNYNMAIYENFNGPIARELSFMLEDFNLTGAELYELTGAYPELDIENFYSLDEMQEKADYWKEMFPKAVYKLFGKKAERKNDMVQ